MKLRTRKFLAGLLSLGLLLQAASPLSALAADDSSAAHTLTVTVGSEAYTLTSDGADVTTPNNWPLSYPNVSYEDGFVFDGGFNGNVVLEGGENVTIKGASYAVNGSLNATVNDLTVTKSNSGTAAAIRGAATITSAGDLRISGNLDYSNIHLVNQAVEGKLTVNSAQDVSIDGILNGGADINCQTLSLNCGNGSTVHGTLIVHNAQKIQATAYAIYGVIGDMSAKGKLELDGCTGAVTLCNTYGYEAVQAGTVEVKNLPIGYVARYYAGRSEAESTETKNANDCARYSYFRIEYVNPSNKTLTLTNAKAYKDAGYTTELINATSVNGTSTYHVDEGKTVYVKAVAPDETHEWTFKGWTGSEETNEKIAVTVSEDMTLTAKWVERITHTLTLKNAEAYDGETKLVGTDSEDGTTTYTVENGKELKIKAVAPDDVSQWKFDGWDGSNENNKEIPVTVTGDMTLTAKWVERTTHTLTLTNAKAYTDDTYQTPLKPTTEGGNEYSVEEGTRVYLKIENQEEAGEWISYWSSEEIEIDSDELHNEKFSFEMPDKDVAMAVKWYKLYNLIVNDVPYIFMDGASTFTKGSGLALTAEKAKTKDSDIRYQFIRWEKAEGSADFEYNYEFGYQYTANDYNVHIHSTEDGDLKLNVIWGDELSYRVIPDNTCELVKAGENDDGFYETGKTVTIKAADAEQVLNGIKVTTKKDGTVISATKQEDGSFTFTMPSSPVYVTAETDAPIPEPGVPGDDDFTGGNSGAGGAVAAVIVGGAAVWGGYEIATRVILHNILPEGAEIPANRGQLALLVWNTAGRPEPVNTPAFVDVADADTAKAAQWCVEQGLMDAKSESTFKPEGWMPKFKTIEVWEKAFPKQ